MNSCQMGPVQSATIVCNNLEKSIVAYQSFLGLEVKDRDRIDSVWSERWQRPNLKGLRFALLGHQDEPDWWLRFIEDPRCESPIPLTTTGWLSLEIDVRNVDEIFQRLDSDYFSVIGEPANLEISDNIRAMQVSGAAGEVLYLTMIMAACPPFELPLTKRKVGRIFIPVLSTHQRQSSLDFYQNLANVEGVSFDTKITVLNHQLNKPEETRYPIGTIQLNGNCLIEVDQVIEQEVRGNAPCGLPPGIAILSFQHQNYEDKSNQLVVGNAGELLELLPKCQ